MTLRRSHVALSSFVGLVAWGLVARWFPVAKFLVGSFVLGLSTAVVFLILVLFSTTRTLDREGTTRRVVPSFLAPTSWHLEKRWYSGNAAEQVPKPLFTSPDVSSAIDELLKLALQDYIKSWYQNISKSPLFVNQIGWYIHYALAELREKILQEDILNIIVSRILPILTAHLKDFDTAEQAVRGRGNRLLTDSDELNMVIAGNYRDGKLHPAAALAYADSRSIQQDHIRKILIRILPQLLPQTLTRSRAVSVLVKEIVTCAVLAPVLQLLSDPDTWNQMIEAYGRATLQDRQNVKRMRAALDEHASPHTRSLSTNEIPKLSPNDTERSFERFVRAIRKVRTLADARRFRSQIASQLAKARTSPEPDAMYIRRLEMGKRVLDQKITRWTRAENGDASTTATKTAQAQSTLPAPELPLTEIMHTASGLSYFMEFMDRQRRMALVQFWVVVDGFRNPLEDDFGEDTNITKSVWTNNDRLDISQISEAHLNKAELNVPQESQSAVQSFLVAGRHATSEQYRAARTAILSAQSAVLDELETTYLPMFRKSDLYYSFLASGEGAAKARQMLPAKTERAASPSPVLGRPASPALGRATPPLPQFNRHISQPAVHKPRDLRRAALSSSDVKGLSGSKTSDSSETARHSFEGEYRPLFDDDLDNDPLASSVASLGQESTNGDLHIHNDVIENMEAAMTDIMTQSPPGHSDTEHDALFGSPVSSKAQSATETRSRDLFEPFAVDTQGAEKVKPSLANLGLVNTSSRIGVFQDNDLFGDEEQFAEDEYADEDDATKKVAEDEIHQAAPGDLGLTEAISILTAEIERLVSQDSVVDTLTRKAELTNNTAELRILGKSKASLQREIRRKELQRQQYIVQESDNSLYGRASINIKSIMVGREDNGQEFAMYVIEVHRQSAEQMPAATWTVTKRYSEFHGLHQKLRRRYPSTRNLEFPRRRMVMKLQKQFLHNRRIALEAYLQHLLRMPDVCRSRELRSFLSQQAISQDAKSIDSTASTQDIVSRIYESVTDGMDEFLGNIAVIDQLSTAGQNLITAAAATNKAPGTEVISIEPAAGSVAEAEAELRAYEDKELEPFVKPICDIFLEAFELNRGNNWLRGRAVVVVLHQLLGGTVERKIREIFRSFFADEALVRYISLIKDTMWPFSENEDGTLGQRAMRQQPTPRTPQQKSRSRDQAADILGNLIPDLTSSVTGRANAQAAARRIMAAMNNRRLNEHLVFTLLDEFVSVLFGPTAVRRPQAI